MSLRSRFRLGKALQIGAIVLCVAFALRGHPPARAQERSEGISLEDARQDDAISTLRESTDKSETRLEQRMDVIEFDLRNLHDDQNSTRTENRVEFGSVAILVGGGTLAQRKRKREDA